MNKKDLRVVKTRNTLYDALLSLMKEKTFEEIKVSDICNKALINRSTFYAHYTDKYELLADCIQTLKKSLTEELEKNPNISNTKEYYLEMIKLFLDHIERQREEYLAIMINNRNSITMDILYDVIDQDIIFHISKDETLEKQTVPESIIAKFYLGAVVSLALEWLKDYKKYTKEELIQYLSILIPDELNNI